MSRASKSHARSTYISRTLIMVSNMCIVRIIKERSAVMRMLKVRTKQRSFIYIIIIVSRIFL